MPLAFLFERAEFPGRRVLGALVALPVVLPPLVGVIAFLFLYGETGFVARLVQATLRLENPPWRLEGAWAILLVHAYSMYAYFYLFTRAGLASLDHAGVGGGPFAWSGGVADAATGHTATVGAIAPRSRPAHLHDGARVIQRPVHLRRRLPGDADPDRIHSPQRWTTAWRWSRPWC